MVGRCLGGRSCLHLKDELARLDQRLTAAREEDERAELEEAARLCRERHRRTQELEATQSLLAAQLDTITQTLDLVPLWSCELRAKTTVSQALTHRATLDAVVSHLRDSEAAEGKLA
jgi:hypothetical protein